MNQASGSTGGPAAFIPTQPQAHTAISITTDPKPIILTDGRPEAPPMPPSPNLPRPDLLLGSREGYIDIGVPLYEAAMKGDWEAVKPILDKNPELVRFSITENHETLLHIAASAESTKAVEEFVTNLVDHWMEEKDLELQNKNYHTALNLAAAAGNVTTVKIMVKKNKNLIELEGQGKILPLYMAALFAKPDMVRYLYDMSRKMSDDVWDHENRGWVLQKCVEAEIFDVAHKIVTERSELLSKKRLMTDVLIALAQNTEAFKVKKPNFIFRIISSILHVRVDPTGKESEAVQLLRTIWKRISRMAKLDIDDILRGPPIMVRDKNSKKEKYIPSYPSRVLFIAAKMGNTRFIVELIRLYPDLIWKTDDKGKTIFHLAAKRRQRKIYKLLYEIGAMKDLITPMKDVNANNMLHMVAKSGKRKRYQDVTGVAFQMQQELLWFKEVQKVIPPQYRQRKNVDKKTPQDLFTENHAKLVKDGEEWMKATSSQCMVVATLIATIVFAAAFTLPGGYNQNTGIPFFRKEPSLIIFVISDAISLISSSTSILMFLSILTSRYAERDFLESLPKKLVNGLATLFLSILTMMIAFSASFFVLYKKKVEWVPILITCLAGIPVILYAILQFRLFRDVFKSAYRSRNLFKCDKRVLYNYKH